MKDLFLGMISGTSIDGVDAVLAEIDDRECRIVRASTTPFAPKLLARLQKLIETPQTSLHDLGALDVAVGRFFAQCALELIVAAGLKSTDIAAIGSHGQTVYHHPRGEEPFSLQLGDPNAIAAETGVLTVADFRRLDIALGGQGAPLVPAFHAWRFGNAGEERAVVNIGGIANITVLAPGRDVRGFDTGPGNTLLDLWIRRCTGQTFDRDGAWAASGKVSRPLLDVWLTEPFFAASAPKSTGRELFNSAWLDRQFGRLDQISDVDVQATLAELTAATIAAAVRAEVPSCREVIVCGGGAHNRDLMSRLQRLTGARVSTTEAYGVGPDWVEGAAFAWLARARIRGLAGNLPTVTGARRSAVLGGVYLGAQS
ncbi:MAG TPA: anhydro-N-acetylmuramic acid kinase [Gammaproteobacteria bacterium]|nr:anhydro-N-acetylmuramic acid kinase [Gammaproteobacteria bacterium]